MFKGAKVVYRADPLLYGPMLITNILRNGLLECDGYTEHREADDTLGIVSTELVMHGEPQPFRSTELELWTVWEARREKEILQTSS